MAITREIERGQSLATGLAARLACHRGTTAAVAPGYVQGNLAALPADLAADFLRFCQSNPKPCPLIGVSDVGNPRIPSLGLDLDIRTDLPGYRVWNDGELVEETAEVTKWWREDLVAFVIGSHSFEEALVEDGMPLRHIEQSLRVPMYRSNIACTPVGRFSGPMVVSMRPLKPHRAIQITSRFHAVHGAPIHIGLPELIGIKNLEKPDYGDAIEVRADGCRCSGRVGSHHSRWSPMSSHRSPYACARRHAGEELAVRRAVKDKGRKCHEPASPRRPDRRRRFADCAVDQAARPAAGSRRRRALSALGR